MSLPSNIRKLRKIVHWTQKELAEKLNVSPQVVSNWERNYTSPGADELSKMAEFFGVTTDYLLGRTDDPTGTYDPIGTRILQESINATKVPSRNSSEQLTSRQIDQLVMHDFNRQRERLETFPVGNLKYVPIVAEIPCGPPSLIEEHIIGHWPVDTSIINISGGDYVWVKAKGDSMIMANIYDGSLVLIRLQPEVESGDVAAVCVDQENATLKRVVYLENHIKLVPENPSMSSITYERSKIRVVGKAVFVGSKL